jgi:hypothetical protein
MQMMESQAESARYKIRAQVSLGFGPGGIIADEAMAADQPDVAFFRDRRAIRRLGHRVNRAGLVLVDWRQLADEHIDLGQPEAGDGDIEFDVTL